MCTSSTVCFKWPKDILRNAIDTTLWLPLANHSFYLGPTKIHLHRGLHQPAVLKTKRGWPGRLPLPFWVNYKNSTIEMQSLLPDIQPLEAGIRDGTWSSKLKWTWKQSHPIFWRQITRSASKLGLAKHNRGSSTTNHFFQSAQLGWLVSGFAKVSAVIE